jgi:formyltetrahydrofolate deformylase
LLWARSGDLASPLVISIRNLSSAGERERIPQFVAFEEKAAAFGREQPLRGAGTELVVLARFMQVLPGWLCSEYAARVINSPLLPAFRRSKSSPERLNGE